jgi:hypothetical protein
MTGINISYIFLTSLLFLVLMTLESKAQMTFTSVALPLAIGTTIAAAACGYAQDKAAHVTENAHLITVAGIGAHVVARTITFPLSYIAYNYNRLKHEGVFNWKKFSNEVASYAGVSKIADIGWAAGFAGIDEYLLRHDTSPIAAGVCSAVTMGIVFCTTVGTIVPRVNRRTEATTSQITDKVISYGGKLSKVFTRVE